MITQSMHGKTVLITGANSGIGLETARGLAALGAQVVMVCRSAERAETARHDIVATTGNKNVHLIVADLSLMSDVRRAAGDFTQRFDRLDVLINNAALIPPRRVITEEGLEYQFALNHLAYFLFTNLLLDFLKSSAPSRIVNVSSDLHAEGAFDPTNLQAEEKYGFPGLKQYANTKLFNHLFTFELDRRLKGTGVTANVLHPGVIGTNLRRAIPRPIHTIYKWMLPKPERGALTSIYLASSPDVEGVSGKYWVNSKIAEPAPQSLIWTDARALWEISSLLIGASDTGAASPFLRASAAI